MCIIQVENIRLFNYSLTKMWCFAINEIRRKFAQWRNKYRLVTINGLSKPLLTLSVHRLIT